MIVQFLYLYYFHERVLVVQIITLNGLTMTQIKTKVALKRAFRFIFCFCQVKKDFESVEKILKKQLDWARENKVVFFRPIYPFQSNQVKCTPQDYIKELIISILNSLVISKNNIYWFFYIGPIGRILGTTGGFNFPIINSLYLLDDKNEGNRHLDKQMKPMNSQISR